MNSYLQGAIGTNSQHYINVLLSSFPHRTFTISSEYAATQIAIRQGPDFVQNLVRIYNDNPFLNGWLLEMLFFFAKLKHTGFDFEFDAGEDENEISKGHWKKSVIHWNVKRPNLNYLIHSSCSFYV